MKNNSSQSRFSKITAKVIVMLLAVVLSLSVLPALSADIFPGANAAVEYGVPANTSPATITAELKRLAASATEVDVILQGNIDLASYPSGIEIPEGLTVNFYMAGNSITYNGTTNWQFTNLCAFVNYGTLNIYSGNRANPIGAPANISLVNYRTDMDVDNDVTVEFAYGRADAIQNYGTVTLNSNVAVSVDVRLTYAKSRYRETGMVTVAAVGINNMKNTASAHLNGGSASVIIDAYAINANQATGFGNEPGVACAYGYGVYGGNVDVTGNSAISVTVNTGVTRQDGSDGQEGGSATAVAYGICTSGNVYAAGGTINYCATADNSRKATSSGSRHVYQGGICYKAGGATPLIYDCTIPSSPYGAFTGDGGGTNLCREAPVATATTLPLSPQAVFGSESNNMYLDPRGKTTRPAGVGAGSFMDECGNTYTCTSSSTDGSHPDAMNRGALGDNHRVHVVYRYWTDVSRKTLDTSVKGKDGTVGYTYTPLSDAENIKIVKDLVKLKGLTNNNLQVPSNSALMYENGADPWNTYYWHLWGLSWAPASTVFSDFNVALPTNVQVFKGFGGSAGTAHKSVNVTNGPIYIFVDYIKEDPTSIKASLPAGKVANTVYTGNPILPLDIGLKIEDPVDVLDITSEYNLNGNQPSLIKVDFSYTGTTIAEEPVSGEGLPLNAGSYTVSLHVDESIEYSTDATKSKNRNALDYEFTLNIEKASAKRVYDDSTANKDTLSSMTVVYGTLFKDALAFETNRYKAELLNNNDSQTVTGKFEFVNSADGEVVKNAGTGSVSIKWTPVSGAAAMNYKETIFSVSYTVNKKPLRIIPGAASVVYGESEFTEAFNATIEGLVPKDDNVSSKNAILGALIYEVQTGGEYKPYAAGAFGTGTHVISPKISVYPEVLSNYNCVYVTGEDNPAGVLTVTKRALTLIATAKNRDYIPDYRNVDVEFSILEGRFGTDTIIIGVATGKVDTPSAGADKQVFDITAASAQEVLGGEKGDNYYVEKITNSSNLYVTINKAMPDAPVPTVAERNYIQSVTLKDITLGETTGKVTGTWYWVDDTINPSVKESRYQARFEPEDKSNYVDKIVDVTINVKPTPVVVSYQATVSYGDNMPNITNYTYTSDIDKKLDITKVETSGNITPRTEYQKGSPVKTGGYPVTITAPNYIDVAGNYTFIIKNGVINVKPRVITFTVQNKTIVYGDSFNLNATGTVTLTYDESLLVGRDTINSLTASGSAPVFSFTSDYREADNYDVGEYDISAKCMSQTSANYEVKVVDGKLHVAPAPLSIKAKDITLVYGDAVPENLQTALIITGAKRNDKLSDIYKGEINVTTDYTAGSDVTADGYAIRVDTTKATFKNYTVNVQNGKITVIKATPVITTYPKAEIVFGQTLGDAVFEGAEVSVDGKFVYENSTFAPTYKKDAYTTFTASFVPADTKNYNTITGQIVALTVKMKPVAGILSVKGIPMVGKELAVDVTGLDPAEIGVFTYKWYVVEKQGDEQVVKVLGYGTSLKLEDSEAVTYANTTVYVDAVAAEPYKGTKTASVLVAPTLTDITAILNATDYKNYFTTDANFVFDGAKAEVYNARPQNISFDRDTNKGGQVAIGDVAVKYNGSPDTPINVGTYAITIDVAVPSNVDYAKVSYNTETKIAKTESGVVVYSPVSNYQIGTLTITPKEYVVTVTVADKVYDGTVKAEIVEGSISEEGACTLADGSRDNVSFNNSRVTYYFDGPDAGDNKTVFASFDNCLTGTAAGNYKVTLYIDNAQTAKINKKPLDVVISAVDREYEEGNKSVDLTFSFTPVAGDEGYIDIDATKAVGTIGSDNANATPYSVDINDADIVLVDNNPDKRKVAKNYTLNLVNATKVSVTISPAPPKYPIPEVDGILYYSSTRTLADISLGNSKWSWKTPNVVPVAGSHEYTAVYDPQDPNYRTVEYEVTLNIRKTVVTIKANDKTVTYGDVDPTYTYTLTGISPVELANVNGYVLFDCAYEAGSPVIEGGYPIILKGEFESDNYDFRYVNGKVTVNKRTLLVDVLPENREYEPGNVTVKVKFSPLENLFSGDTAKDVYLKYNDYITGIVDRADAGVQTVKYTLPTLDGTKAGNYEVVAKKAAPTVEILKAVTPGVILPTSGKLYYGSKLNDIEYTSNMSGIGNGTVSMENPSSTPAKVGTFSDVYKVVFTPEDTKNYATISQYITVTVLPAYVDVSIHFTGTTQVGKKIYVITDNLPAEAATKVVFEWYRVDTPEADPRTGVSVAENTDSYTLTEDDAGKYIMCTISHTSGSPYECYAICVTDSPIEELQLTFWQKFVNWFYNIIANFTQIFGKLF